MSKTKIHVPPKYNQYGNRQLWVVETGRESVDDVVNGVLFGLLIFSPLWMRWLLIEIGFIL